MDVLTARLVLSPEISVFLYLYLSIICRTKLLNDDDNCFFFHFLRGIILNYLHQLRFLDILTFPLLLFILILIFAAEKQNGRSDLPAALKIAACFYFECQ